MTHLPMSIAVKTAVAAVIPDSVRHRSRRAASGTGSHPACVQGRSRPVGLQALSRPQVMRGRPGADPAGEAPAFGSPSPAGHPAHTNTHGAN